MIPEFKVLVEHWERRSLLLRKQNANSRDPYMQVGLESRWDELDTCIQDLKTIVETKVANDRGSITEDRMRSLTDVVVLAKQTRLAQDRYFSTRDPADLRDAKRLERELDSMLAKLGTSTEQPKQAPVQGSLFDNTPDAARM